MKIMEGVREQLQDVAAVDQAPKMEGRSMVMIVSPKKEK